MPRISASMSEEMYQRLIEYRQANGLRSESAALVELAAKGLGVVNPVPAWGGDRKSSRAKLALQFDHDFDTVPDELVDKWGAEYAALSSDYDPAADQDLRQEIREYFNRAK